MTSGTQLRDESLDRIAILAKAVQSEINGETIVTTLYPDLDPNVVLRDIAVTNTLVRILTATFQTLVEAQEHVSPNPKRESTSEDYVGGGSSGEE